MRLQTEIQSLVTKFTADLEALVRVVAVDAVQSVLGASSSAAKVGINRIVVTDGKIKTAASPSPKPKQSAIGRARDTRRARRTVEQIAEQANQIALHVKAHPNSKAEQIKDALKIADNQWQGPLALLLDSKRLIAKGERRATTYNVGGASSAGAVVQYRRP